MADLDGRIALVTGASRGLGAATARALAAAGARVAVTDLAAPEDLAAEIGGIARAQDVTDEAGWAATMDWIKAELGGLDILVNNAGLWLFKAIVDTSLEDWRRLHAVNVEGVFLGTRAAIPLLAERATKWRGGTAIVNISSVAGLQGTAGASCYNSTKGADPGQLGPPRGDRHRHGPPVGRRFRSGAGGGQQRKSDLRRVDAPAGAHRRTTQCRRCGRLPCLGPRGLLHRQRTGGRWRNVRGVGGQAGAQPCALAVERRFIERG
jgi:hypothetical protein